MSLWKVLRAATAFAVVVGAQAAAAPRAPAPARAQAERTILHLPLALAGASPWRAPSPMPTPEIPTDRGPLFQTGGAPYAVAAHGRFVYLGVGPRVRVVDIADVATPLVVAETAILGGLVEEIALEPARGLAVVAATTGGTHLLDVSEPTRPQVLASLPTADSSRAVLIAQDTLYVADGRAGLAVWEITDPARPRLATRVDLPGEAVAVAKSGWLLAVAAREAGIRILDARPPTAPQPLAGFQASMFPTEDVVAWGLQVFVRDRYGLHTIDLQNPRAPVRLGTTECGCGDGLLLAKGYLYAAAYGELLKLVPRGGSPLQVVGRWQRRLGANAIAAVDGRLLVAGAPGLEIFDLERPDSDEPLGALTLDRASRHLALGGTHLYSDGAIYDVADPAAPRRLTSPTPALGTILAAWNKLILTASSDGTRAGVDLYEAADPARPRRLATLAPGVFGAAAAVGGGIAVVVGDEEGGCPAVDVVDVSDPARPSPRLSMRRSTLTRNPISVAVSGQHAFIGLSLRDCDAGGVPPGGLLVIDLEHPEGTGGRPQLELETDVRAVAIRGRYAYLALDDVYRERSSELLVVDISRPMAPTVVGRWAPLGAVSNVVADSAGVYVAAVAPFARERWGGVAALDVGDPTRPVPERWFASGSVTGMAVGEGILWSTSPATGLWAWRASGGSSRARSVAAQ